MGDPEQHRCIVCQRLSPKRGLCAECDAGYRNETHDTVEWAARRAWYFASIQQKRLCDVAEKHRSLALVRRALNAAARASRGRVSALAAARAIEAIPPESLLEEP